MLSQLVDTLPPSPIIGVFNKAFEMRQAGDDLIDFSDGEPGFDTPSHICDAGIAAILAGETRYTLIDDHGAVRAAVIEKFQRDNRLRFTASEVIVSPMQSHLWRRRYRPC